MQPIGFAMELPKELGKRLETFQIMFDYLDNFDNPIIIETGTTRTIGNLDGDGNSTVLFSNYLDQRGCGHLYTIDIDPEACKIAEENTGDRVTVICSDSLKALPLGVTPNLLYLDSYDLDLGKAINGGGDRESSEHHLKELMAALPDLSKDTLVVVDDALPKWNWGKAADVKDYYDYLDISPLFSDYQAGWIHGH